MRFALPTPSGTIEGISPVPTASSVRAGSAVEAASQSRTSARVVSGRTDAERRTAAAGMVEPVALRAETATASGCPAVTTPAPAGATEKVIVEASPVAAGTVAAVAMLSSAAAGAARATASSAASSAGTAARRRRRWRADTGWLGVMTRIGSGANHAARSGAILGSHPCARPETGRAGPNDVDWMPW